MRYHVVAKAIAEHFDLDLCERKFDTFEPFDLAAQLPEQFRIGVVVGPSGSGKSQALTTLGDQPTLEWHDSLCVVDHFKSADSAQTLLAAAGLNSVPQWLKPYAYLSTGEKHRADVARRLEDPTPVIDEFTSTVDRTVAMSICCGLERYASADAGIIVATCHYDVLDWLSYDWVLDTSVNTWKQGEQWDAPTWFLTMLGDSVGTVTRLRHPSGSGRKDS